MTLKNVTLDLGRAIGLASRRLVITRDSKASDGLTNPTAEYDETLGAYVTAVTVQLDTDTVWQAVLTDTTYLGDALQSDVLRFSTENNGKGPSSDNLRVVLITDEDDVDNVISELSSLLAAKQDAITGLTATGAQLNTAAALVPTELGINEANKALTAGSDRRIDEVDAAAFLLDGVDYTTALQRLFGLFSKKDVTASADGSGANALLKYGYNELVEDENSGTKLVKLPPASGGGIVILDMLYYGVGVIPDGTDTIVGAANITLPGPNTNFVSICLFVSDGVSNWGLLERMG